jgi:hypothetical protein
MRRRVDVGLLLSTESVWTIVVTNSGVGDVFEASSVVVPPGNGATDDTAPGGDTESSKLLGDAIWP